MLIPWPVPLPEVQMAEFDPHVMALDLRGSLARPGQIHVSPEAIVLEGVSHSQPTVHILTAEVPFVSEFTVKVQEMRGDAFPFQVKVWDPRSEMAVEGWYGPDGAIRAGVRQHDQWLETRRLGRYVIGKLLRWHVSWDGRRVSLVAGSGADRAEYVIEPNVMSTLAKAATVSLSVYASVPGEGMATAVISDPRLTVPRQTKYATRWQHSSFRWPVGFLALLSLIWLFTLRRTRPVHFVLSFRDAAMILAMVVLVLLVSWRPASAPGHPIDSRAAMVWSHIAEERGPQEVIGRSLLGSGLAGEGVSPVGSVAFSYPPLLIYLFWGLGKTVTPDMVVKALKILGALATAIGGGGLYLLLRRERVAWHTALLAASAYALNPAILFDGIVWGQTDAFVALALLLGAGGVIMQSPPILWVGLLLAVLTKQTGMLFAPILMVVGAAHFGVRRLIAGLAPAILISFLILTPLLLVGLHPAAAYRPLITKGVEFGSVSGMDTTNAIVSQSAFTLWSALAGLEGLRGLERLAFPDYAPTRFGFSYFALSRTLFVAFVFVIALIVYRRRQQQSTAIVFLAIAAYSAGAGVLLTRIQPRYLFFAVMFTAGSIPWISRRLGGAVLTVLSGTMLAAMWGTLAFTSIWYPGWLPHFQPERFWLNHAMATAIGSDIGITIGGLLNTVATLALLAALWINGREPSARPSGVPVGVQGK